MLYSVPTKPNISLRPPFLPHPAQTCSSHGPFVPQYHHLPSNCPSQTPSNHTLPILAPASRVQWSTESCQSFPTKFIFRAPVPTTGAGTVSVITYSRWIKFKSYLAALVAKVTSQVPALVTFRAWEESALLVSLCHQAFLDRKPGKGNPSPLAWVTERERNNLFHRLLCLAVSGLFAVFSNLAFVLVSGFGFGFNISLPRASPSSKLRSQAALEPQTSTPSLHTQGFSDKADQAYLRWKPHVLTTERPDSLEFPWENIPENILSNPLGLCQAKRLGTSGRSWKHKPQKAFSWARVEQIVLNLREGNRSWWGGRRSGAKGGPWGGFNGKIRQRSTERQLNFTGQIKEIQLIATLLRIWKPSFLIPFLYFPLLLF